jgi:hypothetical protein
MIGDIASINIVEQNYLQEGRELAALLVRLWDFLGRPLAFGSSVVGAMLIVARSRRIKMILFLGRLQWTKVQIP